MKALSSKKSSNKRRNFIIIAVLAVLVAVCIGGYYVIKSNQDAQEEQKTLERDRNASKTNGSAKRDSIKDKNSNSSSSGLPENSTSTTSDQVQSNSALSVSIASTSQVNHMVNASAKTSGDGTCVFQYKRGEDVPTTKQVPASSGVCSVSVNEAEIPPGNVKLTVTYYSGGNKAEVSQNVTIN